VGLTVELEDHVKRSELLTATINQERVDAAAELRAVGERLAAAREARQAKDQTALKAALDRCDGLLQRKKECSARLRATAEVVRRAEAATAAAVAEAAAQGEAEAADARKTWRGGEAARRQRFLAKKADDARAQTLKGLEPEVEAIMSKHRATLRRLKGEHDVALAALRAEAAQAAEAGAARAAAEGAAALGRRLDSEAAAFRQRVDQLARAQEGRLRELQREQQQELEDVRRGHRDGACVRT
jgi:hypothetical protein